jgi:large subunit ribosomal protein L13
MLPNSPLFRDLMKNNLKIYKDANHPHDSQNPKLLDFKSMNRKNGICWMLLIFLLADLLLELA